MIRLPERKILITPPEIAEQVSNIALKIYNAFPDTTPQSPLVLLCVMKSAETFARDLETELAKISHSRSCPIFIERQNIQASSYGNNVQTSGEPVYDRTQDDLASLRGRQVIVIEDMIDTGTTLFFLLKLLREACQNEISITVTVLLRKIRSALDIGVDEESLFIGFSIQKLWVHGYNIDTKGRFRNLPHIEAVIQRGGDLQKWYATRKEITKRPFKVVTSNRQVAHPTEPDRNYID